MGDGKLTENKVKNDEFKIEHFLVCMFPIWMRWLIFSMPNWRIFFFFASSFTFPYLFLMKRRTKKKLVWLVYCFINEMCWDLTRVAVIVHGFTVGYFHWNCKSTSSVVGVKILMLVIVDVVIIMVVVWLVANLNLSIYIW